jgi:hypothetical protein
MATYCVSIHDLRLLLRQTEDTADCRPLDSDSDQPDHDNHDESDTTDSWSLDTDSDQPDLDENEETKPEEPDRQKVFRQPDSCPGIQSKWRRQQPIDDLGERDCRSREEGSSVRS